MPWHSTLIDSNIFSVHAALIPVGDQGTVLMMGGSEHNPAQGGSDENPVVPANVDRVAIFDVAMRMDAVKISSPTTDVFCAGHAFLADGRLLVGGGTEVWGGNDPGGPGGGHGHFHGNFGGDRECWIYNHDRRFWERTMDMGFQTGAGRGGGRWYPSIITLPSGDLAAFGGHPSRESEHWHENDLPERYHAASNSWSWYSNAFGFDNPGSLPGTWYPRVSLVTGGNLFFTTITSGNCRLFNPENGNLVGPNMDPPHSDYRYHWNFSVISLPFLPEDGYRTRVMTVGGVQPQVIQLNEPAGDPTPTWQDAGMRQGDAAGKRREFACPVYLPTGQILVTGGIDGSNDVDAVKKPELFTPNIHWGNLEYQTGDIGSWQTINEEAQKARNYHSVSLLLPDGSVFTAGSNVDGQSGDPSDPSIAQRNIELYFPSYYDNANRPTIADAPAFVTSDDDQLRFDMGSAAEAAAVEKVALIRCGSVTHAGDFDHRYVALRFTTEAGSPTVVADLPGDASVLPPGHYMLWAVNTAGLPCQVAPFVRMAHVSCQLVIDRDVFAREEVQSYGGTATFPSALYPMFDGFLPAELPASLSVSLRWQDDGSAVDPSDLSVSPDGARWLEHPNNWSEVAQRVTYPYSVSVNPSAFNGITDSRTITVVFSANGLDCSGELDLVLTPNPYMIDIDPAVQNPHWLSTDIRTFRVLEGETRFPGVAAQGAGDASAETYARAVIDHFRAQPENASHPFVNLPRESADSAVDLAASDAGRRVFNYAVAKVRYRAETTAATNLKVFFRLCTTLATGLAYDSNGVYNISAADASAVPLLGTVGGELVSIPFFLGERVETRQGQAGAQPMTSQPLVANYESQTVTPTAGQEVTAYFACWLDINHDVARFPLDPGGSDGPWPAANCQPIRDFFRSPHHCLVTEIFFEPDLTGPGKTPANSDNLSQRNLALLNAENPGSTGGRTVVHPVEFSRSRLPALPPQRAPAAHFAAARFANFKTGPDELLFDWGNLPRMSEVTLYFSNLDTADIVALAQYTRRSPMPFEVVDDKTLRLRVGNGSWLPVPGGDGPEFPALFVAELPPSILSGQEYRVTIHQVRGRDRKITGAVEIKIPATKAPLMVDGEVKTLSIMKHIKTRIPSANRWWPIFQRYVSLLEGRVTGLGIDPTTVHPNPNGTGQPVPDDGRGDDGQDGGGPGGVLGGGIPGLYPPYGTPGGQDPGREDPEREDPGRLDSDEILDHFRHCCTKATKILSWGITAIVALLVIMIFVLIWMHGG